MKYFFSIAFGAFLMVLMSCKKDSTPSSSSTTTNISGTSIASTSGITGTNGNKPFIVYGHIPYNVGGVRNWYALNDLLKMSYAEIPEAVSSNMVIQKGSSYIINQTGVKTVGATYNSYPYRLVTLDVECWKRYFSDTPDSLVKIVSLFRKTYKGNLAGFYSAVPPNTYGVTHYNDMGFIFQVENYKKVADVVDYLAPSLYNYPDVGHSNSAWLAVAQENFDLMKQYYFNTPTLKIIPFISIVSESGAGYLTYNETLFRLKNLKSLGADGCVIWAAGLDNPPNLNPNGKNLPDWAQAILDFNNNNNCQLRPGN